MFSRPRDAGRTRTFEGLKSAYRRLVLKTHPDAVGSDRHLESYLELSNRYEEAKANLAGSRQTQSIATEGENRSHRPAFFHQLDVIESLEMPCAFHLAGRDLYAKQARQHLSGIMHQLVEKR